MIPFSSKLIKNRGFTAQINGEKLDFSLNKNRNFKSTSLTIFLGLPKNKVGKGIKSTHISHLWVLTGFSAESEKSVVGKYLKSEIEYKAPYKKDAKIRR